MTAILLGVCLILALSVAGLATAHLRSAKRSTAPAGAPGGRRILFPFVADGLSERGLDASLRLARAEEATLVPAFLARVSMQLPLDTPLPRQASLAISLQEAIEQRATQFGIPVDARIERGRSYRHALRQTIAHERFDRVVVAAAAGDSPGFGPDDIAWLLRTAPGEVVVLRPDHDDMLTVPVATRPPLLELHKNRARQGKHPA